jgi:hypothetical protein
VKLIQPPPVYSEDGLSKLQDYIDELRIDLGAFGAILQDQSGRSLVECGSHGSIDVNSFLVLQGNAMSASDAVVQLLRDESSFDLHIHEGTSYDIYTGRISRQIFLTLIFEKREGSSRVGIVWLALRRAVSQLRTMLTQATLKEGNREDKEIKSAVASSLSEALNRLDDDLQIRNHSEHPKSSTGLEEKQPAAPEQRGLVPPAESKPVRKRLGSSYSWAEPDQAQDSSALLKKPKAPEEADLPELDPNQPISFEEARRRGLINFEPDE